MGRSKKIRVHADFEIQIRRIQEQYEREKGRYISSPNVTKMIAKDLKKKVLLGIILLLSITPMAGALNQYKVADTCLTDPLFATCANSWYSSVDPANASCSCAETPLPSEIAYENESNTFTEENYFMSNVGIGTASPTAILHTMNGNPIFERDDGSTVAFEFITNKGVGRELSFQNDGSDFQVRQTHAASYGQFKLVSSGALSTTPVRFTFSAPDNSLVLSSAGKLGLGTTNPSGTLTVIGDIQAHDWSNVSITESQINDLD